MVTYSFFDRTSKQIIGTTDIDTLHPISCKEDVHTALMDTKVFADAARGSGCSANILFIYENVEPLHCGGKHRYLITYSFAEDLFSFVTGDLVCDNGHVMSYEHLVLLMRLGHHAHTKPIRKNGVPIIWSLTQVYVKK